MKTKLTDRLIRTRKPPATGRLIIADTAVPGLSLRINPASTKNPDGLRYWLSPLPPAASGAALHRPRPLPRFEPCRCPAARR